MTSNLILVVGPVLGLLVARLFGPWRPLSALAAAVMGQIIVFGGYAMWQHYRTKRLMAEPPRGKAFVVAQVRTTLGRRLIALAVLFAIAAVATVACLTVQFLVSH